MSSQIQITGETKVKSLTGVLVGTSGVVSSLNIDGSLGIPQLDVNGKILVSQLPNSVTSVFGRTGAVVATSGDYTTAQVTEVTNLYYTDTRARLALSFVAGSGAYNNTTGVITIPTNNNQITNGAGYTTNVGTVTSVAATGGTGISITGSPITTSGTITITNTAPDQVVALTASTGISVTGTYPNFTITNTSPSSGGTVTSVAALTLGTSGTDLSSSVATSTTTPVITLNVPTASAANRGALSSADWTTFNNKYNLPSLTSGSVLFSNGSTIAQDNANFFWDDTNNRLGIGTASPAVKLHIIGGGEPLRIESTNATGGNYVQYKNASGDLGYIGWGSSANNNLNIVNQQNAGITFLLNSTEKMILDSSGNLGLGVTPSAWNSIFNVIQGPQGSVVAFQNNGPSLKIGSNFYYSSLGQYEYINTNPATRYEMDTSHRWSIAPSGTAGNAITFTQAMTLFSDGNLLLTNSTVSNAGYKLDVNGTGRFSGTLKVQNASSGRYFDFVNDSSASYLDVSHSLNVRVNAASSLTTALTIASTGAATFSSSVTATSFFESSSIKGKDIIATNPLLALDIDVIKYTRKSDESKDIRYGYSAEQIHSLMPELTDKDVTAVKYLDVHTILISQLQKEIKELKAKMN